MSASQSSTNKQTLAIFWHFTKQHPILFWYATFGSIASILLGTILPPLVIASAFNKLQTLFSNGEPITFAALQPYFWAYVGLQVASIVAWRTQAYASWKYMIMVGQKLMNHIFNHLQFMDNKFHSDRFGGALVSQTNKFVSAYDRIAAEFNWSILTGVTAYVASLIVLLNVNFAYATVFFGVSVLYTIVIAWRMKLQMPYNRALATAESTTTAKLADAITNVATVRAFAGEAYEKKIFYEQTARTRKAYEGLMGMQLKNEFISQMSTNIIMVAAFGIGLISVVNGSAQIGTLYLALAYTLGLTERLWQFMFILRNMNRAFGDAADMTETLQLNPAIQDPVKPLPSHIKNGAIEFKDVVFNYARDNKPLFDGLNLSIKAGEQVGLVGHSGGGKSSLVRLLSRTMDVTDGAVLIDGQDIAKLRQRDVRSQIGYVPQDPLLFHRSLMDNIRYGKPDASDDEVIAVAKLAHAHEFIDQLPQGYDTLVGERGIKLSGGQRQRIAIARAMLKNAPILVLDEATSALDSESEILIQDALWKLMKGRTAIVIAHRLSTIQRMDRIVVLEHGRIIEQGSHKHLLAKNGTYAKLWAHQSGGFIDDDETADE